MADSSRQMLELLRQEAESRIGDTAAKRGIKLSEQQIKELLHELQVQQIELEMQNDELKISGEEIEAQRIKFAGLYDLAPVGYFILSKVGIIEEINTTGISLLGTERKFIINKRFQSFITAEGSSQFYSFLQRMTASSSKQSCQQTMITPKGDTFYAQIEGTAIKSHLNEGVQFYLAVIDITERRNAEIKQRETMERLAMSLDASSTGTWEIDPKKGTVTLDDFCSDIFGIAGRFNDRLTVFLKAVHPDDRRKAEQRIQEAITGSKELDLEFRIIRPDKRLRHIGARGHVVATNDTSEPCFVGILSDITEKRQLESEALSLRINQQKAIQASALQAQENERKRISEALHDSVSQLLYGIKLKLQHSEDVAALNACLLADLNAMLEQAIKETRNISFELAPSILKDFGLGATIDEMAKRLCTNSLKIETCTQVCGELPLQLQMSAFRIVQELTNNSIKHSDASNISIEVIQKNKSLNIYVTDNGKGFKTTNQREIMGTGLASIKNRLSLFNGKMKIESKPGTGAKVNVSLKTDL